MPRGRKLRAVAKREGHEVVAVFTDSISGAKGRGQQRPGLNSLLEGVTRREFDKVMAWSVDRLGLSLQDLLTFIAELKAKGVDLYLHQQHLDTSTPWQGAVSDVWCVRRVRASNDPRAR